MLGGAWWCMVVHGGTWSPSYYVVHHAKRLGGLWWYMEVHVGRWEHMVVHHDGGTWWYKVGQTSSGSIESGSH